jgi:hypothetical protein
MRYSKVVSSMGAPPSVTVCARVSSLIEHRARPSAGAAQQRLHARQDFLEVIRLGDVVIGARLQAFDFVLPAVARGKNQDRKSLAGLAQRADEIET